MLLRSTTALPLTAPASVLVVDDDPTMVVVLSRMLESLGRARFALSGSDAISLAESLRPDVILLDINLPDMSGLEVCSRLKANPVTTNIPVIFITGRDDEQHEIECLERGAADFIAKPVRAGQVLARVRVRLQMKQMADALRGLAQTDALTGLANRRTWDEVIEREWARVQRSKTPISLLMIDIDYFKPFNDHYGHPAGDECIRQVASALRSGLRRPADLLARYGGEEFSALLPETPSAGASCVAQKMIDAVAGLARSHAWSQISNRVTVSIGVASFEPDRNVIGIASPRKHGDLTNLADQALYAAKQQGRDRACSVSFDTHPVADFQLEIASND